MWVYRAELNPYAASKSTATDRNLSNVDIEFDATYVAGSTWVQRSAQEPRLPRVEGLQFITD
eukprot:10748932-Karenia_brevis.AAC.1